MSLAVRSFHPWSPIPFLLLRPGVFGRWLVKRPCLRKNKLCIWQREKRRVKHISISSLSYSHQSISFCKHVVTKTALTRETDGDCWVLHQPFLNLSFLCLQNSWLHATGAEETTRIPAMARTSSSSDESWTWRTKRQVAPRKDRVRVACYVTFCLRRFPFLAMTCCPSISGWSSRAKPLSPASLSGPGLRNRRKAKTTWTIGRGIW